jgi:ABC-type phosphate/phosphonate transport system substrate-binding protein
VADLKGRVVATGAKDSPQATLIPLNLVAKEGLRPGEDFEVRRFDVLVGKHGDHIGGELDALKCLQNGEADAAAMLDLNWDRWSVDGTIDPNKFRILTTTPTFDHCVFTVREDFSAEDERRFLDTLFSMSYDNPDHREMMDMEGLKEWLPGRTSGFDQLNEAVDRFGFLDVQKEK